MAEVPKMNTTANTIIPMGKCIDCGNDWGMLPDEKVWWEQRVAPGKLVFPRRCKSCRDKNRERLLALKGPPTVIGVIQRLEEMSMEAINDEYDDKGDLLAQKLADLASELKPYRKARPQ